MNRLTSVLVISHDVVGSRMAGPGIRYHELARALCLDSRVTLATPGGSSLPLPEVEQWPYEIGQWDTLAPAVEGSDAILCCGDVLAWFPMLGDSGIPLIVDGYDPHTLETLALFAGTSEQERRHQERERILQTQCRTGDFFICASERQRDWWLGLLEATGRVNVHTYNGDPSLRGLIDVVPFGLPSSPPRHTKQVLKGVWPGITVEDKVVLWGGGLWQWLDPLTAIRAMVRVCERRDDVKLVFPGTRHPNPSVPEMPICQAAVQLAEELGLRARHVFFGDWVPYQEWPNYLLESDVGLSLHLNTLETRLAFRSRVLDYVWAKLPMVVTQGDVTGELVVRFGLGEAIDYGKHDAVAAALLQVLERPPSDLCERFERAQAHLTWERAAAPLVAFCRDPHLAPDRADEVRWAAPDRTSSDRWEAELRSLRATVAEQEAEIASLQRRIAGFEQGRFIRMMKWLDGLRPWGGDS